MKIGNKEIQGQAVLAPLAGISNLPFRLLCLRHGAAMVASEMMSCHGLCRNQPNTKKMLATNDQDHPLVMQLFGADPKVMAQASLILANAGADIIDLNFGCPVPKVVRHKGGSALLKEPVLLGEIVKACVETCPKPVTVKIRTGWDQATLNASDIAARAEDNGAAAIAVHGRTRAQKYEGQADWSMIKKVKERVTIPVIGNGDVVDGPTAAAIMEQTGCDAVMIGRAALGRPWVFKQINHYLATGQSLPEPPLSERVQLIREHHQGLKALKGERSARLEMRKHTAWYLKGWPGAAKARCQINSCETEKDFLLLLDQIEANRVS